MRDSLLLLLLSSAAALCADAALESARNRQDRPALEKAGAARAKAAKSAPGHYETALAYSYLSEVALERRDKRQARSAAELGIAAAKSAM